MLTFVAVSIVCAAWLAYVYFAVPRVKGWPLAGRLAFVGAVLLAVAVL